MKTHCFLFVIVLIVSVLTFNGCNRISLNKPGGSTGSTGGTTGGGTTGGNTGGLLGGDKNGQPPPVDGDWELSFEYKDQMYQSEVVFSQSGNQLAGRGEDAAGAFMIDQGTINGTKVQFNKLYATANPNQAPIVYSGELQWMDIPPDFKGWALGGHYTTTTNGQPVEGKWIATPKNAPPPDQSAEQQPEQQEPVEQAPPDQPSGPGGPNLSGLYNVSYQFNFKKIHSKMWLEHDGKTLRGHGVDTNTNEKFTIPKGSVTYPKIWIVRKYQKGTGAASTREMTFKGTVGPGPSFRGETQFGGSWDGKIVR